MRLSSRAVARASPNTRDAVVTMRAAVLAAARSVASEGFGAKRARSSSSASSSLLKSGSGVSVLLLLLLFVERDDGGGFEGVGFAEEDVDPTDVMEMPERRWGRAAGNGGCRGGCAVAPVVAEAAAAVDGVIASGEDTRGACERGLSPGRGGDFGGSVAVVAVAVVAGTGAGDGFNTGDDSLSAPLPLALVGGVDSKNERRVGGDAPLDGACRIVGGAVSSSSSRCRSSSCCCCCCCCCGGGCCGGGGGDDGSGTRSVAAQAWGTGVGFFLLVGGVASPNSPLSRAPLSSSRSRSRCVGALLTCFLPDTAAAAAGALDGGCLLPPFPLPLPLPLPPPASPPLTAAAASA